MPLAMLDERERLDIDALRALLRRARGRPAGGGRVHGRAGGAAEGRADRSRRARRPCCCSSARPAPARPRSPRRWPSTCSARGDRMIRIDLSEYQNPGSARRMLGTASPTTRRWSARIRRQPFSVVLLDEFEKADPSVLDLFLQVFDDGRLSDPRGEPADFRHAVIIMTSNLGATDLDRAGLGFSPDAAGSRRARRAGGDAHVPAASSSTASTARSSSGRCRGRSCARSSRANSRPCSRGAGCAGASGRSSSTTPRSSSCSPRASRPTSVRGR